MLCVYDGDDKDGQSAQSIKSNMDGRVDGEVHHLRKEKREEMIGCIYL